MKKNRNEMKSVKVMETYVKVVESEINHLAREHGLLLSNNLSLEEENAILKEALVLIINFIKKADEYDDDAFKQYILTVENERLLKTIERISNEIPLGGSNTGMAILHRPEKKDSPYNKPIIFEK